MDNQLLKRIKSFAWRFSGMAVVAIISFLLEPATMAALAQNGVIVPAFITVVAGLIVSEITKWLNSKPE